MSFGKSIPGETPIDDISGLKIKGLSTRGELNQVEAENVRKAIVKYLSGKPTRNLAPFDLSWALKLHKEMFGDVWTWAGEIRKTDLNIGVAWHQVEICLHELLVNAAHWDQLGTDLVEQSAMLHHRAVYIHPFMNGNGRWARMMGNIWLRLHDRDIIAWPEETIGSESTIRTQYLATIQAADDGDFSSLIELHRKYAAAPFPWAAVQPQQPKQPTWHPAHLSGGTVAPILPEEKKPAPPKQTES